MSLVKNQLWKVQAFTSFWPLYQTAIDAIFLMAQGMKCPIKSGFILWLPEVLLQARIITHSSLLLYPRLDFCSQEASLM